MPTLDLLLIRSNDQKKVYGGASEFAACEPPFWAAVIAAYVRENSLSVGILDAEALDLSPEATVQRARELDPRLIGLIVTGTNLSASTWKMQGSGILAKMLKDELDVKLFMWGLHPSALPERTLEEESIDFVICGENLDSVRELVRQVQRGENGCYALPGVFYRAEDGTVKGNKEIILNESLDAMPTQAIDLLPMDRYRAHNWQRLGDAKMGGYAVVATSVGCPFQCEFCAVSALFGGHRVRYRSPKKVVEEIDVLVQTYGIHYIKILDECFVLNRKHVEEICDLLIKRNYDLNIWAYARVDTIDADLLGKLYRAGFHWLGLGIESARQDVLKDVSKGQYSRRDTEAAIRMIHDAGIHIVANFMFGLPEDTLESMQETLGFAMKLNCEWPNFYTTMAYPGSKLYYDCIEKGVPLPESWIGYSQYSYECVPLPTRYLSGKDVLAFRDNAFQAYFANNEKYYDMIRNKFGGSAADAIKQMSRKRLQRKLLSHEIQEGM